MTVHFAVGPAGSDYTIRRERAKAKHQQWVFRNGLRGTATVVSTSPGPVGRRAGLAKNRLAELNLKLDLAQAAHLKPGLALPVVVNPGDPEDIVLVW